MLRNVFFTQTELIAARPGGEHGVRSDEPTAIAPAEIPSEPLRVEKMRFRSGCFIFNEHASGLRSLQLTAATGTCMTFKTGTACTLGFKSAARIGSPECCLTLLM